MQYDIYQSTNDIWPGYQVALQLKWCVQIEVRKFNCATWQNQKFLCAELCLCLCFPNTGEAQEKQMFNLEGGGVLSLGFCVNKGGGGGCCWPGRLAAAENRATKQSQKQMTNKPPICL